MKRILSAIGPKLELPSKQTRGQWDAACCRRRWRGHQGVQKSCPLSPPLGSMSEFEVNSDSSWLDAQPPARSSTSPAFLTGSTTARQHTFHLLTWLLAEKLVFYFTFDTHATIQMNLENRTLFWVNGASPKRTNASGLRSYKDLE
jgi:hypothetical protein